MPQTNSMQVLFNPERSPYLANAHRHRQGFKVLVQCDNHAWLDRRWQQVKQIMALRQNGWKGLEQAHEHIIQTKNSAVLAFQNGEIPLQPLQDWMSPVHACSTRFLHWKCRGQNLSFGPGPKWEAENLDFEKAFCSADLCWTEDVPQTK